MIDLNKFDTIIFDFGGVILDIDPEISRKAFSNIFSSEYIEAIYSRELLIKFENGLLSLKGLLSEIESIIKTPINEEVFKRAWTAMLLEYKSERIEWIKKLGNTHNLLMLSNTNEVHYEYFSEKLKREYNLLFSDLFNNVFLSHEMQLIKPNLEIFKKVLEVENLNPSKTLFIEDTKENVIAANQLGIKTLLIPRNGNFYDYFI